MTTATLDFSSYSIQWGKVSTVCTVHLELEILCSSAVHRQCIIKFTLLPKDSEFLPKVCYYRPKNSEILSKLRNSESVGGSGPVGPLARPVQSHRPLHCQEGRQRGLQSCYAAWACGRLGWWSGRMLNGLGAVPYPLLQLPHCLFHLSLIPIQHRPEDCVDLGKRILLNQPTYL